ncbi:uncharacterized protein LOC110890040 [Helianthus annuus]|uniref:uncharacterized protein LOC110890040 n=1 Tax=Helianthus annuus TaxID=4232 RepID=UPI000B8F1920|nr:uncharacterized protein LOC110890040 [Helianthus annuus]
MEQLLEDGPWMIRNVPIILKQWSSSANVTKEEITEIPVWVKMHEVPLPAFTEDGLSLLASKIGVPKMVDSYTASMCSESWGRSSFARALIEVHASKELKRSVKVAIPSMEGTGYATAEVKIEYDWEPMRCSTCCVFGHDDNTCPKQPKPEANNDLNKRKDNFQEVKGKNKKGGQQGVNVKTQKQKVIYRPVVKKKVDGTTASSSRVHVSNPFDVLQVDEEQPHTDGLNDKSSGQPKPKAKGGMDGYEEVIDDGVEVDELLGEIPNYLDKKLEKKGAEGASTPGERGF